MKHRIALGFLVSIIVIYLIAWKPHLNSIFTGQESILVGLFGHPRIDFSKVWISMKSAKLLYLGLSFLINPVHVLIRSHRWTLMIKPVGKLRVIDSYSIQMVGYMANGILPLRIGEFVRGILVGSRAHLSRSTGLATVLLERSLDVLSLLAFLGIAGFLNAFIIDPIADFNKYIGHGAIVFGAAAAVLLGLILYLTLLADPDSGLLFRILSRFPKVIQRRVKSILSNFIAGFEILKSAKHYFTIIVETASLWILYGIQLYLVMVAFGFNEGNNLISGSPIIATMVVLLISAVGLSIPSAPAGIGAFHGACMLGLSLVGISDQESAAGFAVLLHALTMGFYIITGFFFMWREGVNIRDLKSFLGINKRNNH